MVAERAIPLRYRVNPITREGGGMRAGADLVGTSPDRIAGLLFPPECIKCTGFPGGIGASNPGLGTKAIRSGGGSLKPLKN